MKRRKLFSDLSNEEKAGLAVAGGGAAVGSMVSKDKLTGTVTRYHNTSKGNVGSIMEKGILGKYASDPNNLTNLAGVPQEDNLVYLHKNKKPLRTIGAQRSKLKGEINDDPLSILKEYYHPKHNKTLKVVLDYDKDVKGKAKIANPELLGAKSKEEYIENFKKKHLFGFLVDDSQLSKNYNNLKGSHIIKGNVDPSKIVGSKHFKKRTIKDVLRYAKNNKTRFGKEVAKGVAAAGLVSGGVALGLKGYKNRKNKEK